MVSRNRLLTLAAALVTLVGSSGRAVAQDQSATPQPGAPAEKPPDAAAAAPAPAPAPAATPEPALPVPAPAPAVNPAEIAPEQPAETVAAPGKGKQFGEEIVVTGSRIRRKDLTTPAPVAVLNKEQIQASGKVSLGEFLQTLPEQGNALNTAVNNGGSGATRVDLRGLGNQRTLVLINGRRMVGVGTGIDSGSGADLNAIPIAAVERIEVLKDGASAVYGSDAIAGVVNVITKKAYSGVEANLYSGISTHGDGFTNDVNVTAGSTGDAGSFMFSAGFYDQQKVGAFDRPWSQYQLDYDYTTGEVTRIGSSRVPNGRILLVPSDRNPGAPGNAAWQALLAANPTAGSFTFDPTACSAANPTCYRRFSGRAVAGTPGGGDLFNFQPPNYDVTPGRRISLYSAGDAKVSEAIPVRAFFEGSYTNRNSSYSLAPEPLIIGSGGLDVVVSAKNGYNPFGRDFTQVTRRLVEFGPRQQSESVDTFRVVGGLNGILPFGWTWETSLNYGRTDWTNVNTGNIFKSRLQNAVGPTFVDGSGTLQCDSGDGKTPIAGCVPLDLFHGVGTITPAMASYLSFAGTARISNQLTSAQVNTAGELPITLLADRPLGVALGYEYRFEQGVDTPDPLTALGESSGNNRQATGGHFWSNEAYGELSVPIVNHMPGVESLEATAAVRFVDYNTFGTNTSYKFGARYSPIRDVTFRGTYSTAFRAPTISELFLGTTDNFPSVQDPCANLANASADLKAACLAGGVTTPGGTGSTETQLRTKNGGNPSLKPETAKTWTFGTVIEPQMVKNLSFTVDYYWIEIKDAISTAGAGFILSQCYPNSGTPNPAYCALVHRDASQNINRIDDINLNVGGTNTAGLDFSARYQIPTADFGRFGLGFDGTWLQYYNVTQPGGKVLNMKGNFDQGVLLGGIQGVYPAFKGLASAVWGLGGLGLGASVKYTGKIRQCSDSSGTTSGTCFDNTTGLSRDIGDYATMDAFVGYNFKTPAGTTQLTFGVNNIFDAAPRTIYGALEPNSDPTAYDFMGRFFYVRLGQRL